MVMLVLECELFELETHRGYSVIDSTSRSRRAPFAKIDRKNETPVDQGMGRVY